LARQLAGNFRGSDASISESDDFVRLSDGRRTTLLPRFLLGRGDAFPLPFEHRLTFSLSHGANDGRHAAAADVDCNYSGVVPITEGGACCHPCAAMQALVLTSSTPFPENTVSPWVIASAVTLRFRHCARSALYSGAP